MLPALLESDEPVRVVARSPDRLPAQVRRQVEVIEGSHADPDVVDRALKGARALFGWCPVT